MAKLRMEITPEHERILYAVAEGRLLYDETLGKYFIKGEDHPDWKIRNQLHKAGYIRYRKRHINPNKRVYNVYELGEKGERIIGDGSKCVLCKLPVNEDYICSRCALT